MDRLFEKLKLLVITEFKFRSVRLWPGFVLPERQEACRFAGVK